MNKYSEWKKGTIKYEIDYTIWQPQVKYKSNDKSVIFKIVYDKKKMKKTQRLINRFCKLLNKMGKCGFKCEAEINSKDEFKKTLEVEDEM